MENIPKFLKTNTHKTNISLPQAPSENISTLWIYRIMVKAEGYKSFLRTYDFSDDKLAEGLEFGEYVFNIEPKKFNPVEIKQKLFKQADKYEKNKLNFSYSDTLLKNNVECLGNLIGLTKIEIDILLFCATVQNDSLLESATEVLGDLTAKNVERLLCICLGYSEQDIRNALLLEGRLVRSGLINIDISCNCRFSNKIVLLEGLIDQLHINSNDPGNILKNIIFLSKPAKLNIAKFSHLRDEIDLLSNYLNQVTIDKSLGVNVLIYGQPGSGKSEFVKTIANYCDLELYEVASESKSDTPLDVNGRFRAFRLGQILCTSKNRPAIMFDEVEDVFSEKNGARGKSNNSGRKLWVNQLLESNAVPSFWITNNVDSIDPAYIRRFDFVLQINSPPRKVREELLRDYLGDLPVSSEWIKMMSENETLLPALIERSTKVLKKSNIEITQKKTENTLETLIGNSVEAMGYKRLNLNNSLSAINYRLDRLNTDFSVESIFDGLNEFKQGRLCLYGPPGTGKTAFGKYLSAALDMPLINKKASDITSPYLGVSEQNMAAMFKQAKVENSILMLDEADTFLSDRKNAERSWEISAVNEMLTQMESFEGIFIASTNFMQSLDSASIRRFDIKLKFDYMTSDQVIGMFEELILQYSLDLDELTKYELEKLNFVTPGDFAVIHRKLNFIKIKSTESILEMIKQECQFKAINHFNRIGF